MEEEFKPFLFDITLKVCLKPFNEMREFISEDSEIRIQKNCRNLRSCFGPPFTFKTVVFSQRSYWFAATIFVIFIKNKILELRKDLDKEARNDIL